MPIFPCVRLTFLSIAILASAANNASADLSGFGLSVGGLSDDFIGRSEQYGTLSFNGLAFKGSVESGRFSAAATIAKTYDGDINTLANYDISIALGAGDWSIGIGKIDRNWSPSEFTSLIMSRNAPAFHSAYIRKSNPSTTDFPVLHWMGDWDGEFFVGTTDDAGQPDGALIMGMRARIRPIDNLELDFVRTAQWGGAGQSQDLDTFLRIVSGRTNSGAAAGANQMAGIGISYSFPNLADGVRLYYQGVGEDEANYLPSCFMHLAGVEVNTPIFGIPSSVSLEHTDTRIDRTAGGYCGPNTAYRNNMYSYANDGFVMGSAIDTESVSTVLRVKNDLPKFVLDWSIGHFVINDQSLASHRLTTSRAEGLVVTAGISREFLRGKLGVLIAHQNFDLNTAGFANGTRVGFGFETAF